MRSTAPKIKNKPRFRRLGKIMFLALACVLCLSVSVIAAFAYDTMIPANSLAGVVYNNSLIQSEHPFDLALGGQYAGIVSDHIIVPSTCSWDLEYTADSHIVVSVQYNFTCKDAGYTNLAVAVDGLDNGAVLSASFIDSAGWSTAAVNISANRQTFSSYTVYGDPYRTGLGFESVHFDSSQSVIAFGRVTLQNNYDYSIILKMTTSYSAPDVFWGWEIPTNVSDFFTSIYALPWVSYLFTIFVSFALFSIFMQFMR